MKDAIIKFFLKRVFNITAGNQIGEGSFGKIYQLKLESDKVVKFIDYHQNEYSNLKNITKEIELATLLGERNIGPR